MSEELKCLNCQKKDKEIARLKVELDNLRNFFESLFDMAKLLCFGQDSEIETGKDTDVLTNDTDNNVVSMEE
jgi:hypothetical protein